MKTTIYILLFLTSLLEARENPFFPVETEPENTQKESTAEHAKAADDEVFEVGKNSDNATTPVVKEIAVAEISETVNFQYLRIIVSENKIQIETKDDLIKAFIAEDPKVIILNFRHDVDFATRKRRFDISPFYEVRLGAHKNYYSFVVELNDAHTYAVEKSAYGYELKIDKISPVKQR